MKKRKQFPIYLDWEDSIRLMDPEDVKQMLVMLFEFYTDGVEPNPESPMLKMFFADKLKYMKRLEEDRLKKLQEYQGGSKEAPRVSKEEVRVSREAVGVDVEVGVDVPVSALSSPTVIDNVDIEVTESQRKKLEFEKLFADIG